MPEWFEDLPDKCPPPSAYAPKNQKFYRLVPTATPSLADFVSQRVEFPFKEFNGVDECILRSVSIFENKEDCERPLKLARHKHKTLCELTLVEQDGVVQQTFKPSHHSWWRSASFKLPDTDATPI